MKEDKTNFKPEELQKEFDLFIRATDALSEGQPLTNLIVEYLRDVSKEGYLQVSKRIPAAYNFFRSDPGVEKQDLDHLYENLNQELHRQLELAYRAKVKGILESMKEGATAKRLSRLDEVLTEMAEIGLADRETYRKTAPLLLAHYPGKLIIRYQESYKATGRQPKLSQDMDPKERKRLSKLIKGHESLDSLFKSQE